MSVGDWYDPCPGCGEAVCECPSLDEHPGLLPHEKRANDASLFQAAVMRESHRLRVLAAAREQLANEEHAKHWKPPASFGSLTEELSRPDEAAEWRIKGLLGVGHNAIVVAKRKAGKTTLIGNLVRSLVDCESFLGRFDVTPGTGAVAIFNYEVDERQYRRWLRETGIINTDQVHVLHLRGSTLPLSDDRVRAWVVKWLKDRQISTWIPDPYSRAYIGSVVNGNADPEVGKFLDTLDVIKAEAGVSELVMPVHSSKAKVESGDESAIGSQRLEGWPDSMWYLTKDYETGLRFLRAEGRDIDVDEEQLTYDLATRSLKLGGWDRATTIKHLDADHVVEFVRENPGCTQNTIGAKFGWGATKAKQIIAATANRIRTEPGPNKSVLHYVTGL